MAEFVGVCVDGNTPCADLEDCNISTDCDPGFVCVVGTCCDRNVCISVDGCDGGLTTRGLGGAIGGEAMGLKNRGYGGDRGMLVGGKVGTLGG